MMKALLLFVLALAACNDRAASQSAAPLAAPSGTPTTAPLSSARSVAAVQDALVGTPAPDFRAKTHDGKDVHLADLKGRKVVIYFYPKDETAGCTEEACALRDSFSQIEATGAVLFGISEDDVASHKAFADHHKLPFSLISDAGGAIAKLYSVPTPGGRTLRQTFVIGEDGRIAKVYRHVTPSVHAAEILADVRS